MWVSGTDKNHGGCWVWAAPIITRLVDDTMWYEDEPDGSNTENCIVMAKVFNWDLADNGCSRNAYYLCKRAVHGTSSSFPTEEQARTTETC